MIIEFLNELITYPAELQFLIVLVASTIVVISVTLFYSLLIGLIGSLFNRR